MKRKAGDGAVGAERVRPDAPRWTASRDRGASENTGVGDSSCGSGLGVMRDGGECRASVDGAVRGSNGDDGPGGGRKDGGNADGHGPPAEPRGSGARGQQVSPALGKEVGTRSLAEQAEYGRHGGAALGTKRPCTAAPAERWEALRARIRAKESAAAAASR